MFQALGFVVLAAFVAFGATLFMATNDMDARSGPATVAPEAPTTAGLKTTAPQAPKGNKNRSANRSSRGPTSSKKNVNTPSRTPVVTPMPKNPPPSNGGGCSTS